MDNFFADFPHLEPGSALGFCDNQIVSNVEGRSNSCLSAALDSPDSRYIAICGDETLVRIRADAATAFHKIEDILEFSPDFTSAIVPGHIEKTAIVAVRVNFDAQMLDEGFQAVNTRSIAFSSSLTTLEASAVGMATSLLHWHKTNQYCGSCGAPSRAHIGGMRRDCSVCKRQSFPRTDPAVIMLAVKENKCLLGRSPNFPPNWYSCLAGFVEPGESIEQAVRREVREESGIEVGRVQYLASQPWPFPHALMIGAFCQATSEEISFDGEELEDCRWFEREEVLAMLEKRHKDELRAPPTLSIAAHILSFWLEKTT